MSGMVYGDPRNDPAKADQTSVDRQVLHIGFALPARMGNTESQSEANLVFDAQVAPPSSTHLPLVIVALGHVVGE